MSGAGSSSSVPTTRGASDGVERPGDLGLGVRVAGGVDVGRVLRPDDEVGARSGTGGDLGRGVLGRGDVVVEDLTPFGVEVQAGPRDVALDRHHVAGSTVGRQRDGEPRHEDDDRAGEGEEGPRRGRRARGAAPAQAGTEAHTPAASRPPASATAKVTAGAPARAARRPNGRVGLAEREPDPGEAAVGSRSRSASCTTQARATTSGRIRGRAPAAALKERGGRPEQGQEQRLRDGQGQPGDDADDGPGPAQRVPEEDQAGDQAEQEPRAGPGATRREGEEGDPGQGQRPDVVPGERRAEGHPGEQGEAQAGWAHDDLGQERHAAHGNRGGSAPDPGPRRVFRP